MRGVSHDRKESKDGFGRGIVAAMKIAFTPPKFVVVLAMPAIAALMAWAFLLGNADTPLSSVAYVASAYLFIVLCVAFVKSSFIARMRETMRRSKYLARALDDPDYRRKAAMVASLCIDIFWAAANLAFGVRDVSVWLVTLGAYYLVFALARGLVLARLRKTRGEIDERSYGIERICGVLLLVSTFVLSGIVTLTIKGDGSFVYEGLLIYAVATFAFYSLISSIVGFFRLRKHEDPLVVANARINLSVALVSLYALEIAMFSEFATDQDALLVFIMPIITGALIAVVLIAMGMKSIVEGSSGKQDLTNRFMRESSPFSSSGRPDR